MNFRTEIQIAPLRTQIDFESRLLALGSCFAEHIAAQLAQHKFRIAANPAGILFNPLSIAAALGTFATGQPVTAAELHHHEGLWHHFGFHGSFSATDAGEALAGMNAARQEGAAALHEADTLLLTFGTAWVYEHDGEVVANCHKQPAGQFARRRLTVAEIVDTYTPLFSGALRDKHIILTVSPVRHLGDGLAGNAVSKAVLRLAAEELAATHEQIDYFPAYEILTDDLRDYRFYADDLVHPAPVAIGYVWEKFAQAALTPGARGLLSRIAEITAAAAHRPLHPGSESHKAFCRKQLELIDALPQVDFRTEREYFRRCLEINS